MAAEVHVNDIGTVFEATFEDETGAVVDLSTQTAMVFYFRRPNGTVLAVAPSFTTNGQDGKARYLSVAGDLNAAGHWELQGRVTLSGSGSWFSSRTTFLVVGNVIG